MSPSDGPGNTHLRAQVSGVGRAYLAGRDQRIYERGGAADPGTPVGECPYPGLAAFGPEQARWFFGRDGLIAELVARLDQRLRTGGVQVVVAPSGSGKSSLLRAGLLPRLDRAALPGSDRWPKLVMTPTADPFLALATQLAALAGTGPPAADPSSCGSALARLPREDANARVVVVVDQFEELFTLCTDDQRRRAFIDLLVEIADVDSVGLVVVGVRADFYAACVDSPQLRAALQDAPLVVGPMSETELREAVLFPAQAVGLDVEPGLVELLLRDLGTTNGTAQYEAGRLPLLAHALRMCWQQRYGRRLTVRGYQDTGGIQHAVAITANQVYARLDEDGQRVARSLFLRLVKIGEGTEDVRRRVPRAEVLRMSTVVDAFTQARLLTQQQDSVEITHEALLHNWPRLRNWIDTDRAGRLTHQNLEEAAAAWDRGHRDPSMLYRDARLDSATTWAAVAAPGELSAVGQDFLAAGRRVRRRTRRRRTAFVTALAVLAALATVGAGVAYQQQREARDQQAEALRQRDLATYNRILAEADRMRGLDGSVAAQLDIVAYRMRPNGETYTRLVTAGNAPLSTSVTGHTGSANAVAFSPDGRVLASGGVDRSVRLWDVSDPTRPALMGESMTGHTGAVSSVAFSPDGRVLATGSSDKSVRLWDVSDPTRPIPLEPKLTGHTDAVNAVAFSPDGRTLATGSSDKSVRLWNVSDPARPRPIGEPLAGHTGAVTSVAFSPNGLVLASAGDLTARLWVLIEHSRFVPIGEPLTGHTNNVASVAFSPDGRTLATGSFDFTTRLWNVIDLTRPTLIGQPLAAHSNGVFRVAFSPDGLILATGSTDQSVRLWNVGNPARPALIGQPFTGHTNAITSVVFSPDGHTLATGSLDATVRLWNLPHSPLLGHTTGVDAVAFSPDGRTLATGSSDKSVRLWNVSDSTRPEPIGHPLWGHSKDVLSVAFSPDGRTLASGGGDSTVRLWDVSDPSRPVSFGQPLKSSANFVLPTAFSPDGRTLAAGSADGTVLLWNVANPANPVPLKQPLKNASFAVSVAFSPDGRLLVTGSGDHLVRLWNISDPARPTLVGQPLTGHTDYVWTVAFSPDGRVLASGGSDRSSGCGTSPSRLGQC